MALNQARTLLVVGRGSALLARQTNAAAPLTFEGHRNLTSTPQYKKPFPYEKKKFNYLRSFLEYTTSRLNENSRIVQVEGPPCAGKSELAQKIANEFKLKYIPPITDSDMFVCNGFDLRELNGARSLGQMFYDLDTFYTDEDPENRKKMSNYQMSMFKMRYMQYIHALRHLLSTGQGVVIENSVWADIMYADTLFRHKHLSRPALKYYKDYRHVTLWELWKPHLVIHLDAPTKDILDGLKKKNPDYANSPVLTEGYIETLRKNFKEQYLPYMSEFSEVLSYDVKDMPDFDLFTMDLSKLNLIDEDLDMPFKFKQWRREKEEEFSMYRYQIFNENTLRTIMRGDMPWNAPEMVVTNEQLQDYEYYRSQIPELKYSKDIYPGAKINAAAAEA